MEVLKHFDKQHALLEKRIKEMDEEGVVIKALMSRLTIHALHMRKNLGKVISPEMFCKIFKKMNLILSNYLSVMTEISCKMEMALCEGVHNWNNCFDTNNFNIKPYSSGSNNKKDNSQKQNGTKNLSREKPLHLEQMNCVKKIMNHAENLSNHQLPSSTNLTTDKELTGSNGLASKNSVAIKEEKFVIEGFNVAELAEKDCYGHIQHAVSPSELYVFFATKDIILIEEFDKEISALSKNTDHKSVISSYSKTKVRNFKKRKITAMKELGDYALHFSKAENTFSRAKIEDWNLSSRNDLLDLFLIDHGKKLSASIDDIYPLPENLKKYPAFAVKCHLCDIVPENDDVGWTPAEIEILNKWIEKNEEVVIAIGENQSNPSSSLPIYVYDAKMTKSLNSLIRESRSNGKGVEKSEIFDEALEEVLNEWNPMQEAYDSHLNSYEVNTDHPAVPVYGHIPSDYSRICKIFRETGKCYKGDGCMKEHTVLDGRGYTTDKEEIYTNSFASLNEPNVGDVLSVHLTYIQNGCEFYCVREPSEAESKEETLDSLVSYMNTKKNVDNMKKLKIPPSVGQVVVTKFVSDDFWYRTKVLEVDPEGDEYVVFFVDYGNTETVNLSSMRAIQPQYLHLPFQAMHCKIDGIQIKPGAEEEAVKFLNDNLPRSVRIKVMATLPGERRLLIVELSSEWHWNVGKLLLENEYAEQKENIILNESQSILPG